MKRPAGFANRHRVEIELAYRPPYRSKYNPIGRCRGVMERHWNGTLFQAIATVLLWAATLTWRTLHPLVRETAKVYESGVRLTKAGFAPVAKRLIRSETLPKWSLIVQPADGSIFFTLRPEPL